MAENRNIQDVPRHRARRNGRAMSEPSCRLRRPVGPRRIL